jgi:hypothetical protein
MIGDKSACDKRIMEIINCHGVIAKSDNFINFDLIFLNLFFCSLPFILTKSSQPKFTIILIYNSKLRAIRILLDFFDLDRLVLSSANYFMPFHCIALRIILVDMISLIRFFRNSYEPF